MKITEIRKRREEIEGEIRVAKTALEIARLEFRNLHEQCKHPKMRKYSTMGEIGNYCPDCGYQD